MRMPELENIHACWSVMPQFDKATGEITTAGLLALGGHGGDGALRELKKRCDLELERAKKPLVGCAMYVNMIMGWAKTAMFHEERLKGTKIIVNNAADKTFREGFERSFRLTGEDEIADLIEELWEQYQKEESIPDGVRMDAEEDIAAILKDKYCPVGLKPDDFSKTEIDQSKVIALALGKRKRRAKSASPVPEETQEVHEPEPEEPPEATAPDIRAEIDAKIKRAR